MNIYFSCSITGGRQDEPVYKIFVQALIEMGHEVPTAILARPEVVADDAVTSAAEIYQRDITWINACDAVIAEVSTPSHGVGYEIAYALGLGKPVLCCYQAERKVSKMITGNSHPCLHLAVYQQSEEAIAAVRSFLIQAALAY